MPTASSVSAKDLGTGKEQKITITASSGLSKAEIEKMRKDGELHAEEDQKRKEELETRNEADNSVYRTERLLKDNKEKISDANRSKIETALNEVKEALKGSDAAAIKTAGEKLNETWQVVSAELYKAASEKARRAKVTAGGQPVPTLKRMALRTAARKRKARSSTRKLWMKRRRHR